MIPEGWVQSLHLKIQILKKKNSIFWLVPPLTEELLRVEDFWERESTFFKA